MDKIIAYANSGMPGSMTYDEYFMLMNTLVDEGKTTGENQNEAFVKYTFLNRHRMNRLNKTIELRKELKEAITAIDEPMTWLVLSESWCGDAAQSVPVINQIAQLNEYISLRVILRDENLSIMDELLTNGGRSIPKLVALNAENEVVFQWGPRPNPVQEMVNTYKAIPEPKKQYSEFTEEIQKWYAVDKTATIQTEFLELLAAV